LAEKEKLDPFTNFIDETSRILSSLLDIDYIEAWRLLLQPTKEEYGDASFPLLRYVRRKGVDEGRVIGEVKASLTKKGIDYVETSYISAILNFRLSVSRSFEILAKMLSSGWRPEPVRHPSPMRYVVEHTSANPIHPLHMGHARNSALGDTLSRLLRARGHEVNRRFYIDDVGRQTAVAALGFRILGVEDPEALSEKLGAKPDHLVGWVYAATHTSIDVLKAKREGDKDEVEKLAYSLARLEEREPVKGWTQRILSYLEGLGDHEEPVREIMKRYERGLEPERSLLRRVTEFVLKGFRETLSRLGVEFDAWDWESDVVWSGLVDEILNMARRSKYYMIYKDAEALNIPAIIKELVLNDPEAKKAFKIPKGFEVPPLILVRSDGTTLYTTRDIAYSVYKFREFNADKVINVVGAEQRLPQLQVRLALLGLGFRREALNMIHYDYEMVRLVGMSMSGRRGVYIALDNVIDEVKARAKEEVLKRNPEEDPKWIDETAEKIAVGAVRFSMIQAGALKPLTFDPEKALNFKENSGPYLQYTYARSVGILEKLEEGIRWEEISYEECEKGDRRRLIVYAMRFPATAAKAADDLAPEDLATYLIRLSDLFNTWYQKDPVIREKDPGAKHCKAAMVMFISETLRRGLELLGIPPLRKM